MLTALSCSVHSAKNGEHVTRGDDQVVLALVVHFGATVLGVQHLVTDLDVHGDALALVVTTAGADGQDFTLLRLLLGVVRDEQTGRGLGLGSGLHGRPVILNTWEAVYFDHNFDTLKALADRAADSGVERFVVDDGWFGSRRDDSTRTRRMC